MKDILPEIISFVIGLVVLAIATYVAWRFRRQISEKVTTWLRNHNLEESALMDVWVVCDNLTVAVEKKIVCKMFATTQETGEQQISEEILSPEALEKLYPDVYAQLQEQGHARKSILQQIT